MPPYSSLSLRVDHRTYCHRSCVSLDLEIWHVLNRANVQQFYWSYGQRAAAPASDTPILPLLGAKWQF